MRGRVQLLLISFSFIFCMILTPRYKTFFELTIILFGMTVYNLWVIYWNTIFSKSKTLF